MRRFTPYKRGFRVLGIAESFRSGIGGRAALAGVVMRADGVVDGSVLGSCSVGGMDATEAVISMTRSLRRDDINLLMLNGCIISLFNIIDLKEVSRETGLPLLCLTYNPSEGLTERLRSRFPEDWGRRVAVYESNGPREEISLKNGFMLYVRRIGLSRREASTVLNALTTHGKVPEPLRVAKILARALRGYLESS